MSYTLSLSDLTPDELVGFLEVLTGPVMRALGNLPLQGILGELEEGTRSWATPATNMFAVVEFLLLRRYPGHDAEINFGALTSLLLSAIGNPQICTRGHLLSVLRLLNYYFESGENSSMISTEYIKTHPLKVAYAIKSPSSEQPNPKKRRYSDVGFDKPAGDLISEDSLQALERSIQQCPDTLGSYINSEMWLTLPFPFLDYSGLPSQRFKFISNSNSVLSFHFMPREFLATVYHRLTNMRVGQSSIHLHGPMGLGKSHILAAMGILLRRQGKRVVFLPDCGKLVSDPMVYVQSALLCTFSGNDDKEDRDQIRHLRTLKEIQQWCRRERAPKLYFIVDQLDALETADGKGSSDQEKQLAKEFISRLYLGHVCLRSSSESSANDPGFFGRVHHYELLRFRNGMTERESKSWLERHENAIPTMSPTERSFFFDFTGGIPYFYTPLLEHPGQPFETAWREVSGHRIFEETRVIVTQFATRLLVDPGARESYLDGVEACLTGQTIIRINHRHIDHRFCFKKEDESGTVTCGLARRELFDILRKHRKQLSTRWHISLSAMTGNRSVLGFLLKIRLLEAFAADGLPGMGNDIMMRGEPVDTVVRFSGRSNDSLLDSFPLDILTKPGKHDYLFLPDASAWNDEDIDALHLHVDNDIKAAKAIPIQVFNLSLNATTHKQSDVLFYAKWEDLKARFAGYKIATAFLWMTEEDIQPTAHKTRGRAGKELTYDRFTVPIATTFPLMHAELRLAYSKASIVE
ncbi:hypothetical protein GGX14DRAFT_635270 [Mycena pura]|uniref:Uncharacterized protein n=1 Tax=Mycena pura TaxID=153505 RepID=A0AAD6VEH8_9AGAR|nr:hypothetical protein GGX14DRAFT_635270 [Mycena pura]